MTADRAESAARTRVCERCSRVWQRIIPSPWCSGCRADLVAILRAARREQEAHGHEWDVADMVLAIERWADEPV